MYMYMYIRLKLNTNIVTLIGEGVKGDYDTTHNIDGFTM